MDKAELYQNFNSLQKRAALDCLEEYAKKMTWKNHDYTVIDIGSGDGSVTSNILKKFLPSNCKKLVGCDISEKMVHFANKHYGSDHTSFIVLDIEADLPKEFRANFDHVFSFFVLNWIKQQEAAFLNIYRLLAKCGDCLLVFPTHTPIYDCYRILARNPKWSHLLKDVDSFVSLYNECQDPENEIKRMMTTVGFTNVDVKCTEKSFIFTSVQTFKNSVAPIIPFEVPKDQLDDFLEEFVKIFRDMLLIDNKLDAEADVRFTYQMIVAYGKK